MSLRDLTLPFVVNTSDNDPIQDFFIPALQNSVRYDRGVGYFSSGWLRYVSKGMVDFAENAGRARWITSPILEEQDWLALETGDKAKYDTTLYEILKRSVSNLSEALDEKILSALAWMVADEILTFKIALPRNKLAGGEFHAKIGTFIDSDNNIVSFNGSNNETVRGSLQNYEYFMLFPSWHPSYHSHALAVHRQFQRLWDNQDENVRAVELPEAAREHILKLRSGDRPYTKPPWIKSINKTEEPPKSYQSKRPHIPSSVSLRTYQNEAIKAWFENNCHGLLEMATGTGKTLTSLAASIELFRQKKRLVIVIACPYTHLAAQWAEDVDAFGYRYLVVPGALSNWRNELANELLDFHAGYTDNLAVITTHDTFSNPQFWEILEDRKLPLLVIADEVHELGSAKQQLGLRDSYTYRLGLSATPRRWLDEEGTTALFSFFDKTVYEFSLKDAIPEYLTPYDYFPFFVELNEEELQNYRELTHKLVRQANIKGKDDNELMDLFLILRQRIIVNADAKYRKFEQIIKELPSLEYTLVYCSPEQIDEAQEILNNHRIVQHRFTWKESTVERERLLGTFASGLHKVLVAMNCLDQGVDVPPTRKAIILASSGNPKQFIQRRGRILRKSPNKTKAAIYDIIVVPTLTGNLNEETLELERRILRRELDRYDEFASLALNKYHALNQIAPIKRKYLLE